MTKVSDAASPHYHATQRGTRVNARLDEATQRELEQLQRDTGGSVTDVIREAIHRYYLQAASQAHTVADDFADLVGCIDGPADLSTHYKAELLASLARKHA